MINLYHGSNHCIEEPNLKSGKINNDYGQGFYCTLDSEAGKQWA